VLIIFGRITALNLLLPLDANEVTTKNQTSKRRGMITGGAACMQDHHTIGGGRIRQTWQVRAIFSAMFD
jgi:hypothetical protein